MPEGVPENLRATFKDERQLKETLSREPVLALPFKERDYTVTEGWFYSDEERSIHGELGHGAVDFALPIGTKIYAPLAGYAVQTYGFSWQYEEDEKGNPVRKRLFNGKPISMSIGRFIHIYHPREGLFTQYAHLSRAFDRIPFFKPQRVEVPNIPGDFEYVPQGYRVGLWAYPLVAEWVEQGQKIGEVGISGITQENVDYPDCLINVRYETWDEPHLHFAVFARSLDQKRAVRFDPYGIYAQGNIYPDPKKPNFPMGTKEMVLWKRDQTTGEIMHI